MNCEKRERQILLAHSGELPAATAGELEEHIAQCGHCRDYRDALGKLFAVSADALRTGTPSERALHRIKVAALDREESGLVLFSRPTAVILAAAAALAVAVGVWTMMTPGERPRSAASLDAIIMMVQEDSADEGEAPVTDKRKTIRELAHDLLSLEGFALEEFSEGTWSTSEEEPPATGLRSSSTPGSLPKICV